MLAQADPHDDKSLLGVRIRSVCLARASQPPLNHTACSGSPHNALAFFFTQKGVHSSRVHLKFRGTGRNFFIVVPVFREVSCMFGECSSAVNYKVSFTINHLVTMCVLSSLQVLPLTSHSSNKNPPIVSFLGLLTVVKFAITCRIRFACMLEAITNWTMGSYR